MNRSRLQRVVNLVFLLVTITVNGLANALRINGQTTAEVSDKFAVYFVPAGYVFAIWGVIYLGLLAFSIYQLLPSQSGNPRLGRVGWWFAIGCLANAAWIFCWHYEVFPATLMLMLLLLASLIVIYRRLGAGRDTASLVEKLVVDLPFSIYLGWITVATVANVTDVLYSMGWNGAPLSPELWAVIMLVIATGLSVSMSLRHRNIGYAAVIVWAFVGIAVKQSGTSLVSWSAIVLAAVAAAGIVVSLPKRRPA